MNGLSKNILTFVGLLALVIGLVSCNAGGNSINVEMHLKLAGELRDSNLFDAAIEEYQKILSSPDIEYKRRANINYLIGKLYFENLKDYDNAAAYYVRARSLNPEGSFASEASRNLITSLERMGRMIDARRELNAATSIDSQPNGNNDVEVARVGGTPIWLSEIDQQIQSLPPEGQKQFQDRATKIAFVHQYVGVELMYHAALRENYDADPVIKQQLQLLSKKLLVDKYVFDKILPTIKLDTNDVHNYYQANKDSKYGGAPLESIRSKVFIDYQTIKTEAAYGEYVNRLAGVEKVEFLDQNVR